MFRGKLLCFLRVGVGERLSGKNTRRSTEVSKVANLREDINILTRSNYVQTRTPRMIYIFFGLFQVGKSEKEAKNKCGIEWGENVTDRRCCLRLS